MGRRGLQLPVLVRDWKDCEALAKWKRRLKKGTFVSYFSHLHPYLQYIGKDPDTALLWGRGEVDKFVVLDSIQNYVLDKLEGHRYRSKLDAYTAICSFYQHNRVMLPKDNNFRIQGDSPPVERKLTLDNLRELILMSPQPYRSMILVKWMGILDNERLLRVRLRPGM